MSLTAKILNSDASLNSFKEIGALNFSPGEDVTLVLRLHDTQEDIRYVPPATAIVKVKFNTTEATLEKTATLLGDDRSIATIQLSATETEDLIGGSLSLTIDVNGNGTLIKKGTVLNALRILRSDC